MPFSVAQKTLERLEWADILARLQSFVRTPLARAQLEARAGERISTALFEASEVGVRERLAETGEAKALLAAGDALPLGALAALDDALIRARKGGTLEPRELFSVSHTLAGVREVARRSFCLSHVGYILCD